MKAKTAMAMLAGLLVAMIGAAWSQRSAGQVASRNSTANNVNSSANLYKSANGGRGNGRRYPVMKMPNGNAGNANTYGPGEWNTNANIPYSRIANSWNINTGNSWTNSGNSNYSYSSNTPADWAANAVNTNSVNANHGPSLIDSPPVNPRRKPAPRKKKRRPIAGTPTIGKIMSYALAFN